MLFGWNLWERILLQSTYMVHVAQSTNQTRRTRGDAKGELLSQSTKLDWLVITTGQTEIDSISNIVEGVFSFFQL